MHKITNILLTCAGGSGPLYLAKALRNKFRIFLVDASLNSPAPHLGLPFSLVPFGNDPAYPKRLAALIHRWRIQCIVPGADEELVPVQELCKKNPSLHAVMPDKRFTELCLNKKRLMEELAELKISRLLPYPSLSSVKYPAIVKPIYGRGSKQVHVVCEARQLHGYLALYQKNYSDVLVQPYISGVEYTVSVIVNNLNDLIGVVPKKILQKTGITRAAVVERNTVIDRICRLIVERLRPMGPCNVQLKMWKGTPYVFEINPRLSTTSVLTEKAFGNEVELYLQTLGRHPDKLPKLKTGVRLYRYDENVFV